MKASQTFVPAFALLLALGCVDGTTDDGPLGGVGGTTSVAGSSVVGGGGGSTTAGSGFGGMVQAAGTTGGGAAGASAIGGQQAGGTGQGGTGPGGTGQGGGGPVPTDGKGLFDANCKLCHGEQGIGSPLAPEIQHPVREYDSWVVRNGRAVTTFVKPMEKWGTDKLSDAQLMLIFDYLDQPPQPTTGQTLYLDYCANCHGADAKGGPTTRNILNEVQNVLKQVRAGKNPGQYQMRHDSMPVFSTMRISDAELVMIRDYVDSL
jgi:mono/diheme cytochrome c family protein